VDHRGDRRPTRRDRQTTGSSQLPVSRLNQADQVLARCAFTDELNLTE
jgi:hypothetical protein